jgi:tRNA(fMet)-specific endonuclease VapC
VFLLDTDHLGILQQESLPECAVLVRRMEQYPTSDFHVSIVSFHEQATGWLAYLNRARMIEGVVRGYARFESLLKDFTRLRVLSFDHAAAQGFESLRKQRVRIGTMDLRIASVALTRGLTVLSRNLVDFRKVPGLQVEDWTGPV